jgi:transposase
MGKSLPVSVVDQEKLGQWIAAHGTPQQVALRCRIVVEAAGGKSDLAMAKQLSVNRHTVNLWRKRFSVEGLERSMRYCPRPGTETHV